MKDLITAALDWIWGRTTKAVRRWRNERRVRRLIADRERRRRRERDN